ncbi:MAG: N-acetyltransferase [Deltaproteobacteria bacterium]|jgi:amino-acid N-acetyltransferase|nr:N-acetyltransferase [Deltaproteobacteria bacterium]
MIRNARMGDIKKIYDLLQYYADKDLLLGRSLSSLYDQLRDFSVFVEKEEDDPDQEKLVGVCALHICWDNLAEIRSLAVIDEYHNKGVGRQLVDKALAEADSYGITKVFTLTYQPDFFRKLGFRDIDKSELPHKVWSDCIQCSKFPDCNEEALIWEKDL